MHDELLGEELSSAIQHQHQERTDDHFRMAEVPDLIVSTGSTGSSKSAPALVSPSVVPAPDPPSTTPTPTKPPYNLLKRLANAEQGILMWPESRRRSEFEVASYVSHTSESVIEAERHMTMLENATDGTDSGPTMTFESISRMMAKGKSAHPNPVHIRSDSAPDVSSQSFSLPCSMTPIAQSQDDRVFETPRTGRQTRGTEVAQGYRSPPQSRHTSPEISLPRVKLFRKDSPSSERQVQTQVGPFSSPLHHPVPTRISGHEAYLPPSSPRSRLTRTLIEIQAELASSREGFEEIESRLGVLERHVSLDREQIEKHVLDCVRSIADEADESYDAQSLDQDMSAAVKETGALEGDDAVEVFSILQEEKQFGMSFVVRTAFCVCLGALATEWVAMQVMGELGRRHILFTG